MKGHLQASIIVFAAAISLVACASSGSAGSTAADTQAKELAAEYQSLIENALAQTVCQRTTVTGSRILQRDVCLTRTERDTERERTLEVLRAMEEKTMAMPQPPPARSATASSTP